MSTTKKIRASHRPVVAILSASLAAFAAAPGTADARSCGMMRPGPHMGMPMHAMPRPTQTGKKMGPAPTAMMAGPSVVDVAKGAGKFSTLLAAVDTAGLTALLEGDGPYTVLAPTDAAFEGLPEGALDALLADKAQLTAVLKRHVIPGRVMAAEILTSEELKTASGEALSTDDLSVIRADIRARNGVIHVLDAVLLPSG